MSIDIEHILSTKTIVVTLGLVIRVEASIIMTSSSVTITFIVGNLSEPDCTKSPHWNAAKSRKDGHHKKGSNTEKNLLCFIAINKNKNKNKN